MTYPPRVRFLRGFLDGFPPVWGLGVSREVFGLNKLTTVPHHDEPVVDGLVTGLDALITVSGFLFSVVGTILYKIDTFYMKIS